MAIESPIKKLMLNHSANSIGMPKTVVNVGIATLSIVKSIRSKNRINV